ncbi:MAG: AAA family ATPase [Prevotella sp.]|jgi:DNA sulfur modification protein DndD|nr:AAA family ATPase [Prevotella sp.]
MIIKRIKISNYKTYLDLDLDLSVHPDKPIILIGGGNGGGKTTLFEAIYGALYGLKIKTRRQFEDLLNDGARGKVTPKIELELTFEGIVLGRIFPYVLHRHYEVNPSGHVVESVRMNMNGNVYSYGTFTPTAERRRNELEVSKIIKGNLPQELSRYFLFDAMQSSELLKENAFAKTIRDNIEVVMGFNKYIQLKRSAEYLLEEKTKERLAAQEERQEYENLCNDRREKEESLKKIDEELERQYRYLADMKDSYDSARDGADLARNTQSEIQRIDDQIEATQKQVEAYNDGLNTFVQHMEINSVLPKIADNMQAEVSRMLKIKEELEEQLQHVYSSEDVAVIIDKVISYLRNYCGFSSQVNNKTLAEYVISHQQQISMQDEYDYLDKSEIDAFTNLLTENVDNSFIQLDKQRLTLELFIKNLPNLIQQKETLEKSSKCGNGELIAEYEKRQEKVKELKLNENQVKEEIRHLTSRINGIDVQMQQEPDPKYDTLVKLVPFFEHVTDELLKQKKSLIETEMQKQLNMLLNSYKDHIGRVEISDSLENFTINIYHTSGNKISLDNLNAASKQIFIQVLLKVLRNLGDYNPPVMIDTVMGVLDDASRDIMMEEYFPKLAEQTILLCTTSEIRKDGKNSDYDKLKAWCSKTYTLVRDIDQQKTYVKEGYFGLVLKDE